MQINKNDQAKRLLNNTKMFLVCYLRYIDMKKIETDFYNVISTIKRIQSLKQSVVAADSAYQQYQVRFKVGNATITDVLDQLKTLYQSESQLAEAKYAYITNMLNLKLDAGILSPEDIDDFNHWLDA